MGGDCSDWYRQEMSWSIGHSWPWGTERRSNYRRNSHWYDRMLCHGKGNIVHTITSLSPCTLCMLINKLMGCTPRNCIHIHQHTNGSTYKIYTTMLTSWVFIDGRTRSNSECPSLVSSRFSHLYSDVGVDVSWLRAHSSNVSWEDGGHIATVGGVWSQPGDSSVVQSTSIDSSGTSSLVWSSAIVSKADTEGLPNKGSQRERGVEVCIYVHPLLLLISR